MKDKEAQKKTEEKAKKTDKIRLDKLQRKIDALEEEKKTLQQEKEQVFDKLQRVSADYANFQKRVSKQIADSIAYEKEAIIKTILPVLDNF